MDSNRLDAYQRKALKQISDYIENGCKGDLEMVEVSFIPNSLKYVGGSLDLRETVINKLPNNLTIDGNLDMYGCVDFKKLPSGLKVL